MKKKATKKPAAKSKLIDGRYGLKQLIRFEPEIAKQLEALQKSLYQKTVNGAIIRIIEMFGPMQKELAETKTQLLETRNKLGKNSALLTDLRDNFKQLMEMEPGKDQESDECPECGGHLDAGGECEDCPYARD